MIPRKIIQMNILQSRNRDTGMENRHMDTMGTDWETGIEIYTLLMLFSCLSCV